nr:S8 family serine peptidase [Candidatus Sigynarchaeota archaeon]
MLKKTTRIAKLLSLGVFALFIVQMMVFDTTNEVRQIPKTISMDDTFSSEVDASWSKTVSMADQDCDKINDNLEKKIIEIESQSGVEKYSRFVQNGVDLGNILLSDSKTTPTWDLDLIPVIVHFPFVDITDAVIAFKNAGGVVSKMHNVSINGFSGTISKAGIDTFSRFLQDNDVSCIIEEDEIVQSHLYYGSRNMNLRPYVWNTLGYTGDANGATAVVDTGIDDSHSMLSPGYGDLDASKKIIGWRDEVSGITSPYDEVGHGSHCSGIVAGSGQPAKDGS